MDVLLLDRQLSSKIEVDTETGCWLWTAAVDRRGYGRVNRKIGDKWTVKFSHRIVYECLVGEIGDRSLDHLCRNPPCCNPEHLEPVTHAENVRRGVGGIVTKRRYNDHRFCPQGHPLFGENLYAHTTRTGYVNKMCRICRRETKRARRAAGKRD